MHQSFGLAGRHGLGSGVARGFYEVYILVHIILFRLSHIYTKHDIFIFDTI